MPKVSVIVPVYKVEPYLLRCVRSIQKQTLKDIEIILVDDGSPDSCPDICDELARVDDRIKVVHKENGGLSSTRNAGMDIATGKYIGFVDSDDSIIPQMYEILYATIEREKVDFVMSDYYRVHKNGMSFLKTAAIREGLYDKPRIREEIFPRLIMGEDIDYGPLLSVCHCLYNTQFLKNNNLRFDEQVRWSEDNIFSAIAGYYANNFYYLKGQGLYNYYENPGTITTSFRKGAWEVYCTMNRHLHQFFDNKTDYDFSRQLKLHIIYYACNCINTAITLSKQEAMEEIRHICKSSELELAFNDFLLPAVSFKLKLQLLMIKHHYSYLLYKKGKR